MQSIQYDRRAYSSGVPQTLGKGHTYADAETDYPTTTGLKHVLRVGKWQAAQWKFPHITIKTDGKDVSVVLNKEGVAEPVGGGCCGGRAASARVPALVSLGLTGKRAVSVHPGPKYLVTRLKYRETVDEVTWAVSNTR